MSFRYTEILGEFCVAYTVAHSYSSLLYLLLQNLLLKYMGNKKPWTYLCIYTCKGVGTGGARGAMAPTLL